MCDRRMNEPWPTQQSASMTEYTPAMQDVSTSA
jgi:hypothetical protein